MDLAHLLPLMFMPSTSPLLILPIIFRSSYTDGCLRLTPASENSAANQQSAQNVTKKKEREKRRWEPAVSVSV